MKRFSFYPGCSMSGSAADYMESTLAVCRHLDLELEILQDWYCCGATAGHAADPFLAEALPAGNLRLHQRSSEPGSPIVSACAACFNRLKVATHALQTNPELAARIDETFGQPPAGWEGKPVPVLHLVELFDQVLGLEAIREAAARRPAHRPLKVAAYYGCLLVRPEAIMDWDDPENPRRIDRLLEAAGHELVEWPHRVECCGGVHGVVDRKVVTRLSERVVEAARDAGADALAAACPLCQANLDLRQSPPEGRAPLPVLYFTQLLGLALGLDPRALGIHRLVNDAAPLLAAAGW